jgi:hypothetical protein
MVAATPVLLPGRCRSGTRFDLDHPTEEDFIKSVLASGHGDETQLEAVIGAPGKERRWFESAADRA